MSERGSFRGGRGRGGRGGQGQQKSGGGGGAQEKPKKENILDLNKYMDKEVQVKFNGGREVTGTLKGLRPADEPDEEGNTTTRSMGLIVARGTLIVLISPADGSEETPNPFLQAEE
ncbi:Ribonucleoprotein LSM domain eukaryotic/archaea-type [Penicillium expansum]|nr:Ribonucleoprotein LSM domain eukaryotic/archaea-type [Penicillium expansum]